MAVKMVGDNEFEQEVEKSDKLTIVDFGATWCGPCKKLHKVIEEIDSEQGDKVNLVEVDVGDSPNVAVKYGVSSVPQLLFFKDGVVKETVVGVLSKTKIEEKIEQYI